MIVSECIENGPALERLVPEWRELLGHAQVAVPVLTPTWLLSWWRVFGGTGWRQLRVVALREDGRLIGIAPLLRRRLLHRGALPVTRIELLASGEDPEDEICSNYIGVLCRAGREDAVAFALARGLRHGALGSWQELLMPSMSGDDPLIEPLRRALLAEGITVELTPSGDSLFVPLPPSWDEYLKLLGGTKRYFVRRTLRELAAWAGEGGYEVRRVKTAEDLDLGKRILYSLHDERWHDDLPGGVFASRRFRHFHEAVMDNLVRGVDGELELSWLVVHGEPVAALYSVVHAGRVHFYQSGRKLDVPKGVRPGIALHVLSIRDAIAAGRTEYDFLGAARFYKGQLSLASRPRVRLRAVAPSWRGALLSAARWAERRLRTEIP